MFRKRTSLLVAAGVVTFAVSTALVALVARSPLTQGAPPVSAQATSTVTLPDEIDSRKRAAEEANRAWFDARRPPPGVTPPSKSGPTGPTSCPRLVPADSARLHAPEYAPGGRVDISVVSQGEVALRGREYNVLSGSLSSDPEQGAIAVLRFSPDPCAAIASGNRNVTTFETLIGPTRSGPITLVDFDPSTGLIGYKTASGETGNFNVINGQFVP
jgi:hypothetical protein